MKTDELSSEAYEAIVAEAEKFSKDLHSQFGMLSKHCKHEEEYIAKAKLLVGDMKKYSTTELHDMFSTKPPARKDFHKILNTISENINRVEEIPYNKRNFEM